MDWKKHGKNNSQTEIWKSANIFWQRQKLGISQVLRWLSNAQSSGPPVSALLYSRWCAPTLLTVSRLPYSQYDCDLPYLESFHLPRQDHGLIAGHGTGVDAATQREVDRASVHPEKWKRTVKVYAPSQGSTSSDLAMVVYIILIEIIIVCHI